jgi:hypothetical protein
MHARRRNARFWNGKTNDMRDSKTTTLGILTILSAVINAGVQFLKTGTIGDAASIFTQISAGVGLIVAADSKK